MQKKMFYVILQLLMKNPILQNIRVLFYFYDKLILSLIKKPKKVIGKCKQVLVVFPFALGDCVLFLGAIDGLRKVYPKDRYEVHITCQKGYEDLFVEHFDSVIPLEYTKASVNPIYRIGMYRLLRNRRYDVVLDPIGCRVCSPNVFASNAVCADEKIGVYDYSDEIGSQCPKWIRERIYTKILSVSETGLHKIRYYGKVWESLDNVECKVGPAELPTATQDIDLPDKYFVVFPGASLPVKQWPVERFGQLAQRIYKRTGYELILCGTAQDKQVVSSFLDEIEGVPYINYTAKTDVRQFIEIIRNARLLVTNDTSAYHIGVATGQKVCVITGGYVYDAFIGYDYEGCEKPGIVCKKRECYNCNNMCKYTIKEVYPCVEENTVEDAWKVVESLLS